MIPKDILEHASMLGFEKLETIALRSGEEVYLVQADGIVGPPIYLHYVDGTIELSTHDESMALFEEPDYMKEV